jgi:uncharacterized protein involved in outer membrane biogenesis
MAVASWHGFIRRHRAWMALVIILAGLMLALTLVVANPQWLRATLQRAVSASLHRQVTIGEMHLAWSGQPVLEVKDVEIANLEGSSQPRMARVGSLNMTISPLDLLVGRVVVPRIAMDDADVLLEVLQDGRANWLFGGEESKANSKEKRGRLRLGSFSLAHGRIRFADRAKLLSVLVQVQPLDRQSAEPTKSNGAPPVNARYAMRFDISGQYNGNDFSGQAQSGDVVSLQDSGKPFPMQLELKAGETQLHMEGTVADVLQLSGVDMRVRIAGPTLANIYPLLLLPLPASPPYRLHGRLRRDGARYALDELGGRIGSTDLEGEGTYVARDPRPLLTVHLRSRLLNMADLGPLIGVETKSRTSKPMRQSELSSREQAKGTDQSKRGDRVLPAGRFDPERLRVIDAEVRLRAQHVKGIATFPLENFDGTVQLRDAVLKLEALKLGAAGGTVVARATLDARRGDALNSEVQADVRRVRLEQLVPDTSPLAKGTGLVSMSATLTGTGNSIADAAAKADGRIAATITDGRVSNLADAASGLAMGRVLAILATGDREIPLNCGGAVFDVQKGQGESSMFVLDTSQTQVLGSGQFDLAQETFALHLEPKPKKKGILSLRTPLDLHGTFSHVDVSLEKKPLVARAGAALALAAVNPVAALLALIETGPGKDTPCASVLREAAAEKPQPATKPEPAGTKPDAQQRGDGRLPADAATHRAPANG